MTLSEFLAEYSRATKAIDQSGELPLPFRTEMIRTLGTILSGHERRLAWLCLELACARKVIPIWAQHFPNDKGPVNLLDELAATSRVPSTVDFRRISNLKRLLDEKLLSAEGQFQPVYAGFASWAAGRNTLQEALNLPQATSEKELDPEEWDACFFAAFAWSGGATWEKGIGNSEKRREFWTWFLVEALPRCVCGS